MEKVAWAYGAKRSVNDHNGGYWRPMPRFVAQRVSRALGTISLQATFSLSRKTKDYTSGQISAPIGMPIMGDGWKR